MKFDHESNEPFVHRWIMFTNTYNQISHFSISWLYKPTIFWGLFQESESSTGHPHISKMTWTTRELEILQTTSRVSSVFSLLGASFIIITFCSSESFHRPINRLAFFAAFGNILTNVATITSREGIQHGSESGLCKAQASFIQWLVPRSGGSGHCEQKRRQ